MTFLGSVREDPGWDSDEIALFYFDEMDLTSVFVQIRS